MAWQPGEVMLAGGRRPDCSRHSRSVFGSSSTPSIKRRDHSRCERALQPLPTQTANPKSHGSVVPDAADSAADGR